MAKSAKAVNKRSSSGVAILHRESILLCKRIELYYGTKIPFGGYWSIFGGGINQNETPKEAAKRELFEESKIDVNIEDINYIDTLNQPDAIFHVHYYKSDKLLFPELNFEHTQYGWYNIFELESFTEKIDQKLINLIIKHAY